MATTIKHVTLKSLGKNKDIDPSKGTVTNPFTQEEYNSLNQTGEWTGGYVEAMGYVMPTSAGLEVFYWDIFYEWWSNFVDFAENVYSIFEEWPNSAYAQAQVQYQSGSGETIMFSAGTLGLNHLKKSMLNQTKDGNYTVNLLDVEILRGMISGCNLQEAANVLSTALALGNITLIPQGDNTYSIKPDKYDFNMMDWSENLGRNIATLLGAFASEFQALNKDVLFLGGLGVICGVCQRHIFGTAEFMINFSGTVTISDN